MTARRIELPDLAPYAARYLAGETARELAAELGTSYQTLQRRLRASGVPLRGKAKTAATRQRIAAAHRKPIDEQRLRELHADGLSCREMATLLVPSVSEEAVRQRLRELELPRLAARARAERNSFYRGGFAVDREGYILRRMPGHPDANRHGYVREHRRVCAEHLGRPLAPGEVVDHRNGDTSDNRPENLRVFATNAEHLAATLTGVPKLPRAVREARRQEAVRRARRRVAAILLESGSDEQRSHARWWSE